MGEMFHFTKKDYRQGIAGQCIVYKNKVFLYQRKGAVFELEKTLPEADEYTILAVFDDNAPACASLAVNGKTAAPVAGYTSCGTGRVRRAAFLFKTEEALAGKITAEIYGMPGIRSLFVTPGKDESVISSAKADRAGTDEIHLSEEIKPLFELENKMQLIVSVGADAAERDGLENALESMREFCPLFRKLGFNGVESYVKWNFVEYEKGVFDWSFYDSVIEMAASYGMGWFPLIIGGSAYALPEWYREKTEGFTGFRCLEHGMDNNIPTIFNEHQTEHIINYLHAFGKHYEGNKNVFGVRLGPSGNYGESQYPASGNWGYKGEKEHMHLGWWAGDGDAAPKYAAWLKNKYWNEEKLSAAWGEIIENFGDVVTYIPSQAGNMRKRKDFTDWYMHEMTDWCNRWAVWMRGELKSHDIYQSAGGWGFCEAGTDFTDQARGMIAVNGGIRATNEDESYELNFAITRMISSAARFYGVPFGSEPAGYGTARSVVNRLYNILINNGQHLFYYNGNFTSCDESAALWGKYAPLLDERSEPIIDVAVLYPDTMTKLSDSTLRHLDGSAFFSQVCPLRRKLDYDFCSERMVLDGALEKNGYKAFIFLSRYHDGDYVEAEVLDKIDEWICSGGTVIYPILHSNARAYPQTVEGDNSVFLRWQKKETGKGRVIFIHTMREPLEQYIDYIAEALKEMDGLRPPTKEMLAAEKPRGVYFSALKSGKLAVYNDLQEEAEVTLKNGEKYILPPISIKII